MSRPYSAALALIVVISRRTRESGKYPFLEGQCPFPGVLVMSTEIVAVDLVSG